MPSLPHEAPLVLLRECPELLPRLLRDSLNIAVPVHARVSVEEADFTQVVPTQYRADLVLTLATDQPVMGVVVEVQLGADPAKRFTWPLYAAALHARLRCPTCLVVIAPDEAVATWAAQPITTLQPESPFRPAVLGPGRIPWVRSVEDAVRDPELAILSALAHSNEPGGDVIAFAALAAAARLDPSRALLYSDLVFFAANEATRRALETQMDLSKYEFKSDFAKKYIAQGRVEGRQEALASAVLKVLEARGLLADDDVRGRILSCTDVAMLERWLERAATAKSAAEVVSAA